ncbi:energy transducer TonB [Sphingomonas naphthae]|uniref:Energy transducer TonB n=1 Tax=Sphingomonas naphthae TaxID=1813468 RepID=A0ABY7THW4_9SPHN|nr:energy transducer TonB [Sphingomonas naphthae]WCT72312.1 energy transducer TonB [Sphingomonas naphthae]
MFTFDKIDLQRTAVSALGAIALSAASIFAVAAPAKAAEPTSLSSWQSDVSGKLDSGLAATNANWKGDKQATVRVALTAEGKVASVGMLKSTGSAALDKVALETAGKVDYPALPGTLAGKATTVAVKLYFTSSEDRRQQALRAAKKDEAFAYAHQGHTQFAAL